MKSSSISELCDRGLLRFDVEFGNANAFFSASRSLPNIYERGGLEESCAYGAAIKGAELSIAETRSLKGEDTLIRRVSYAPLTDSSLYDAVSRFVVLDTGSGRSARINDREIFHRNSNIYYQYPAGSVRIPIGERNWLDFTGEQIGMPSRGFEHVFYVRDERQVSQGNLWIVHHRVIATLHAERLVVRGCNPRFEGPLPRWANSLIPRALRERLFRIREARYPNFPLMAVGENTLSAGHRLSLTTRIECHG